MKTIPEQLHLPHPSFNSARSLKKNKGSESNRQANKLEPEDRPFHDWYRFVLSYPPHLVRNYIEDFNLDKGSLILDPFCGTGTTLVEARLNGLRGIGFEANLFAHFASSVKIAWEIDPEGFRNRALEIAESARSLLKAQGIDDNQPFNGSLDDVSLKTLSPEAEKLLIKNSISPLPLHKALVLLEIVEKHQSEPYYRHGLLALANALVFKVSNLHFGPEVGVRKLKKDVPVVMSWLLEVEKIARDLQLVSGAFYPDSEVHLSDARQIGDIIKPGSIDAVITSPPYPNEKDYTRTTRLESVFFGFIKSKAELRSLKKSLIRSNTRGVYKGDDDDKWVISHPRIQRIAEAIEKRRIRLGKSSGFEKLYGRVTKLYFGGMARHLAELREALRPGAQLAYVVGDQASYLRIMIRTGKLLAEIAEALGYEPVRIDPFRTRFATATKSELHEEVVILRWNGQ